MLMANWPFAGKDRGLTSYVNSNLLVCAVQINLVRSVAEFCQIGQTIQTHPVRTIRELWTKRVVLIQTNNITPMCRGGGQLMLYFSGFYQC